MLKIGLEIKNSTKFPMLTDPINIQKFDVMTSYLHIVSYMLQEKIEQFQYFKDTEVYLYIEICEDKNHFSFILGGWKVRLTLSYLKMRFFVIFCN